MPPTATEAILAIALTVGSSGTTPAPTSESSAARATASSVIARTNGLAIPAAHPRLWYDADRLARARAWYRRHPFQPRGDMWNGVGWIDSATRGLLNKEPQHCRKAVEWALTAAERTPFPMRGVACDPCRWFGEQIIITYDFCFDQITPSERKRLITATNAWIDHWRTESWGGVPMHQNNYYWGYLRNQLEWAITSYEDNKEMAETLLDDVLNKRLRDDFNPATSSDSRGGVVVESSQYGPYQTSYATVPFVTAGLLGRDLLTETNFWREAVYAYIHASTPGPTRQSMAAGVGHTFFPHSDDESWIDRPSMSGLHTVANFMATAAMRWSHAPVGKHAREWLKVTGAGVSHFVQSVDPGGETMPFSSLPLDYYASGPRWLYGRSAWGASSTAFFLQLGDRDAQRLTGHSHADWGTWQIWRKGRFLSRESVGYSSHVAGYGGSGRVAESCPIAHNTVLVNGEGTASLPWQNGVALVRRLESQPTYSFATVDLTPTKNTRAGNRAVVHLEREFVFVRSLETMVILDRIHSSSASDTTAFVAHCETKPTTDANGATCAVDGQELVLTTLVPRSPTFRVVDEGTPKVGQHRIEALASPRTPRSHVLTVVQAKDRGSPRLTPSVEERGDSFVLTLDGTHRITFQKGTTSSGGSITIGGVTTPFRRDVQPMVVTDAGPSWK